MEIGCVELGLLPLVGVLGCGAARIVRERTSYAGLAPRLWLPTLRA